ncbi:hypothetical protein [Spirosoma oryzicola]|uniref:hypothetical protein n=1 Tax=Spirosoma oryzicola TaxID=2898794 RepID=UPI001E4E8B7D|nr:hypothetical protein [Spirosoma oryzicola]UHG93328.1 hypothetical protein LQ777_10590 [Spirosoma oryzicola]
MNIPVVLPVKSHIQKFIVTRYGTGSTNEISVRKMTFLGDMLSLALVKDPLMTTSFQMPTGPILIFQYPTETKFLSLPKHNVKSLQMALDRHFRDTLITFVTGYHYATGNQMQAVKKFLEIHQINDDELTADTAWKIWRDFESKKERQRTKIFRKDVGSIRQVVGELGNSSVIFAIS